MAGRPKTPYQRAERRRQIEWKRTWEGLPAPAREAGTWNRIPCEFILPVEYAAQSVWAPIRDETRSYFRQHDVAWHDEDNDSYGFRAEPGPSPHLLDSQVCAINFWWGLARSEAALTASLRFVFSDVAAVVPARPGEPLVVPEWIGLSNHLGERGWGRRGRCATSADLLIAYEDWDAKRHGVLVESKYTESYEPDEWKRFSPGGTDRSAIYRAEFDREDGPVRHDAGIAVDDLLIEPFDQHLRQQLLARAMERSGELRFTSVTCLHVAPRENRAFHAGVTAPKLAARGSMVGDAWRSILVDVTRYRSASYEALYAFASSYPDDRIEEWKVYQRARYGWGSV